MMVMFWPSQQELDCINDRGDILGKIKYVSEQDNHQFCPDSESVVLSDAEKMKIAERLAGLDLGKYSMPMQDDD